MESMDWPRLKPCVDLYPVQVTRVLSLAPGRFRVDSPTRAYEARVVLPKSAEARMRVADEVAARGFRNTQRFVMNLYHERTVPLDDQSVMYLTDCAAGMPLLVTPEDVRLAAANLVGLHRAIDGVRNREEGDVWQVQRRHGTWARSFEQGLQWIATERVLARAREQDDTARTLLTWLPRFEEQAGNALEALHKAGYAEVASVADRRGDVAWNGYRLDTLLRRPSGKVFTMQTRDPVGDHRLYDLATLCHEVCLGGHAAGVEEALSAYHAERPLSAAEKQVVRAFAAYPHHALALLGQGRTARATRLQDEQWQAAAKSHLDAASALLSGHR